MQAKYRGKHGEYHEGIPMRDLSEEDWSALDAEQRKLVRASTLYEIQADRAEPDAGPKKEG